MAGVVAAGTYFAWNTQTPVFAEAQQQAYAGTVEDPNTKFTFPVHLSTGDSEWKRLIGLGARQVSFLNINVYVLGLYMRSQDIGALKSIKGWEKFDKEEFLTREDMADALLEQPIDVSIRIVPVRGTNTQHLRDGFTRSLLQRMRDQDLTEDQEREIMKGIQEFKTCFPSGNVKKGTEFVFTKTSDGFLKMQHEGKDMGTVNNKWLAVNFIMGYLNPKAPASEYARQDIANGFEKLLCTKE
ncbi:chalcone isomerase [Circinella umbellata]|nr:chalcone isomerase [Circinella umbellata]